MLGSRAKTIYGGSETEAIKILIADGHPVVEEEQESVLIYYKNVTINIREASSHGQNKVNSHQPG